MRSSASSALLSVMELHSSEGTTEKQCKHCKRVYPCPTIKAIEKEYLGGR